MKETRKQLQARIVEAESQVKIWEHRMQRAQNREYYYRNAKERKRVHRLIQYGVVMESHHKELEVLRDEEIYGMMERIIRMPPVENEIVQAVDRHDRNITPDPKEDI